MADENVTPVDSEERLLEQQILEQVDAREFMMRDPSTNFANIVWTAYESAALNKRVTSVYKYYEVKEADGTLIGRTLQNVDRIITAAGIEPEGSDTIQIIGSVIRGQ